MKVALRADQIILVRPDREPDDRPNTLDAEIVDEADFGHSRTLYARVPDATIPPRPPSRSKSPRTPTRSWASPPVATGASTSHPHAVHVMPT